ncbi:hypothetical protein JOD54_004854 [Actinokineospora baliensis]|uniref:hypothetical protein n=1 Tax=Actinokineospora baliensis TaxID=547056 RepID=UPI00195E0F64|nr:hypothetical protein [Actinokineospora baliensis]MBM7774650.1 hypothetical protein [Actinokineospora baliensis]
MAATTLLVTEVTTADGALEAAAKQWAEIRPGGDLFRSLEGSTLLRLTALTGVEALAGETELFEREFTELAPYVAGDFRRQVLTFVEAPKSTEDAVPQTRYVQLRHIEVPPAVFADYRTWREGTIFDVVRRAEEVEVFLAYHSLLSTEPGVMFVSGFDTTPERYGAVFSSAEYQEIVRQAGSAYIAGGERGLFTTIYERVTG